jgi:hypothetical protein
LTRESIQQQGYDMYYIPRETVALDYLFGEDIQSAFTDPISIECYIKSVIGYTGAGDVLAKFGLDIQDDMMIQMHIQRFDDEVTSKFPEIGRPREGDLMYFGLDKHSIFEISFVENKKPYYQLGSIYIYELSLKRFVFSGEKINTGIEDIDDINTYGSNVKIELGTSQSISTRYTFGEIVYQSTLGTLIGATATGEVIEHIGNTLTLHRVSGEFRQGLSIKGDTSHTIYSFPIKSDATFDDTTTDKIADNIKVRTETNTILDFNEVNPFLDTGYD